VISGETPAGYHCRLLTLVKIHTVQLILGLPERQEVGTLREASWRDNLEICQRDVTQCDFTIDPALCLIVMALLVFMHLHNRLGGSLDSTPLTQLTRRKEVLRVVLQNHAKQWMLARLLLGEFFFI
jgi:hypothetical protein